MSENVYVTAIFQVKADCLDKAIAIFEGLATPTRAESGCMAYGFYQDRDDATRILAIETWRDDGAFAAHLDSAHLKTAFAGVTPLLSAEPAIHRCKQVI